MLQIGTIVTLNAPLGLIPAGTEGVVEHVFPGVANLVTVDLDGIGPTLAHASMVTPVIFQDLPAHSHKWDALVAACQRGTAQIKVRSNGR